MELAITTLTRLDFATAALHVQAQLEQEGFGVLTRIDVQETLATKLGVDTPRYLILGACNPPLAHEALSADPEIGLLLPCNVIIRETDEGVLVQAMNPRLLVDLTGKLPLEAIARDAAERLERALAKLPAALVA